jgi:hypothetical protein
MLVDREEEWSRITRVSMLPEILEKLVSEVETMRLIKDRTTIPVHEAYYAEFDPGNPVGAQFMLMQLLLGQLSYQKILISEVARIVA